MMTLVSKGNLDMMAYLFDRYHKKIYSFLLRMTRDQQISQDLCQETFYKALKYRHSYNQRKFSPWIYTIARNLCTDYCKSIEDKLEPIEEQAYSLKSGEQEEVNFQDQKERLNWALNQLSVSDRELIIMSRYQGMKYQEIAELMDSTLGAVKTKVHRALHKLKKHYFKNAEHCEL